MGYTKENTQDGARLAQVRRVLWIILGLNLLVATAKLSYGLIIGSAAMAADGFHSMFDGTSNVVGLVGIALASRPADRDHPYGHAKYETYASAAIGAMLLLAAWEVGSSAWDKLTGQMAPPRVDATAFVIMFLTLGANIAITLWERRVGKRLGSEILIADASHTASDVLVSVGVIIGLVAVRLGVPIADPIIALLVAVAIARTAWSVAKQADESLSDRARIPSGDVCAAAMEVEGVLGCHSIRTRGVSSGVHVDLHIQVDPQITVEAGHAVAEAVERDVAARFSQVVDVIVHLEPFDEYQKLKTAGQVDGGLV